MAVFRCECGYFNNMPEKQIGRRGKCPKCQRKNVVTSELTRKPKPRMPRMGKPRLRMPRMGKPRLELELRPKLRPKPKSNLEKLLRNLGFNAIPSKTIALKLNNFLDFSAMVISEIIEKLSNFLGFSLVVILGIISSFLGFSAMVLEIIDNYPNPKPEPRPKVNTYNIMGCCVNPKRPPPPPPPRPTEAVQCRGCGGPAFRDRHCPYCTRINN